MPCYKPLGAFWDGSGGSVGFSPTKARQRRLELPCGRCIGCRLERSRQWAVRIAHESQMHDFSCFVTLTFDDEHLPPDRSVKKRHVQDFMRRLRASVSHPVRYFGVGEYGSETWRPHYHLILFGIHFSDQVRLRDTPAGHSLFRSPHLEKLWPYGHSSFGAVSFDSARYVAGYCVKKVGGEKAAEHYRRVDFSTGEVFVLRPEFALMSRRPGIGAGWFAKYGRDCYPSDSVVFEGHPGKPPRYYDVLAAKALPVELESVQASRLKRAFARFDESMPKRLRVREAVTKARVSQSKGVL